MLSLDGALRMLQAARFHALASGPPENIAVVDASGLLVAQVRMDGALPGSVSIALDKAWTAAVFRVPTADLARACQPGGLYYGLQGTNGGRVVILPGGLPIIRDGVAIGGIGASGGEPAEDLAVAEAALAAL